MELMNNDELTEEQRKELSVELKQELSAKSTNIIAYVVDSESLLERIKQEEERLANLRKVGENKLAKFKEYVQENMKTLGIEKIQTELGTLTIAKNPMSIEVVDENLVPAEFKREKITTSVDKTAIKNHFLATGELIDGIKVVNDKTTLRIK